MLPKLRANGPPSGEADQHGARLASLKLRKKCGAKKNEHNNYQDSGICAPKPRSYECHSDIKNIEQREPESDFKFGGIVVVALGERPEAAGKRQQRNPRSEPHGGGALGGDPNICANRMSLHTFACQLCKFQIELARHAWPAIVAVQQGSDAR